MWADIVSKDSAPAALRGLAPRLCFRQLRTKLTFSYVALFFAALCLILGAVYATVTHNAEQMVRGELDAGAVVFDRVWALRMAQLQIGAELLADDFGFKGAVATHDQATISSALSNLRRRLGFDGAMVLTPDGQVAAADGLTLAPQDQASLADVGQGDGGAGVFVASGMPYEAVTAPVMAPTLAGQVVFANKLDDAAMASLAKLSSMGFRPLVIIEDADGRWRSGAGGLSADELAHAAKMLASGGDASAVQIGPWMEVVRPLQAMGRNHAAVVLRYPMAAALAPYNGLLAMLLGLGAAAVLLIALGSWALSRQITRPIAALKAAAEQLERGEGGAVAVEGADEIAALGLTFNRMADGIVRRETALAAARIKAEAANRAKSDFLANMSHEIRTPLNGILGMAQVLGRDDLQASQREQLDVIRNSGEALLAILNSILDLSKIEAGQLEIERTPFELGDAVRAVADPFAALAAEKGLAFETRLEAAADGRWLGDALRLRQVLANLASNAVKFTDQGRISLSVRRTPAGLAFEVADTGIGIAADRQDEVFAKFSQVDESSTRRFGGTGLGLAICRELVALMGGTLTLTSAPGLGSTFAFELPLEAVATLDAADAAAAPAEAAAERPLRILAAEDNPTNRTILSALLGFTDAEVTMVEDGVEAVAAFEAAAFDVVLMDIQMTRMSGVAAARAIRAHETAAGQARTPILAVSANVMRHQVDEYLAAGMDGVVAKPLQAETLFGEIERVLGGAGEAQAAVA